MAPGLVLLNEPMLYAVEHSAQLKTFGAIFSRSNVLSRGSKKDSGGANSECDQSKPITWVRGPVGSTLKSLSESQRNLTAFGGAL